MRKFWDWIETICAIGLLFTVAAGIFRTWIATLITFVFLIALIARLYIRRNDLDYQVEIMPNSGFRRKTIDSLALVTLFLLLIIKLI